MLSRLAYLLLCRSSSCLCCWFVAMPPRTWRSWCCAISSSCCAAKSHVPGLSPPTERYSLQSATCLKGA
jgi:hypothetical protein